MSNAIARTDNVAVTSYGLVPTNMSEAMKLADMMASAKLVPMGLQKSPADCLLVIQQAIRWQLDPFAVAQECSVIQGKLMHSGKLVAAVVNTRGNLAERLSFAYEGEGPDRTIAVSGRLQGEQKSRTVRVKLKDAATNNKVWQTQPDQQLMYHGTRVWARRHTPELMLGVYSPEEFSAPGENGEPDQREAPAELEVLGMDGEEGATDIKTVAEARPIYDKLERELKAIKTDEELTLWGNANKKTIDKFRYGWKNAMYAAYRQQREDISKGVPAGPGTVVPVRADEPPTESAEFLKWVDGILAAVTNLSLLDPVYNYQIEPHIERLLPPDQAECVKLFEKHEQRLKPSNDGGSDEPPSREVVSDPAPDGPPPAPVLANAGIKSGAGSRQFNSLALREQAVLLCKKPVFWKFLNEEFHHDCKNETDAVAAIHKWCGVTSRAELGKTTRDSTAFKQLRDKFLAWQQVG